MPIYVCVCMCVYVGRGSVGVVAHSCDSATGELGLWIVVGWDPPDEAGHVEPVSALSLLSTWPPAGSRR